MTNTPASLTSVSTRSSKTILVVDDDDAVRGGLRCVLLTEGYHVIGARNGCEAVQVFREHVCDLALLDINMPLQNGWGAIGALRSISPNLPVILITARPDQRTLAREADIELMEKPLDLPHLLARISELLAKAPGGARQITVSGSKHFDS